MRIVRYIHAVVLATALASGQASAGVWIDVPYIRQSPEGCGPAAIAMVAAYWHQQGAAVPPLDSERVFRELHRPGGVTASSLTAYMKSAGFDTFAFAGTWADLEKHVAQGRPLIVAFDGGAQLHYAVVAGIGDSTVSLNDPADRKLRQYSRADFEQKWSASQKWTLLAVPAASH